MAGSVAGSICSALPTVERLGEQLERSWRDDWPGVLDAQHHPVIRGQCGVDGDNTTGVIVADGVLDEVADELPEQGRFPEDTTSRNLRADPDPLHGSLGFDVAE